MKLKYDMDSNILKLQLSINKNYPGKFHIM